jgi:hypothetical protein
LSVDTASSFENWLAGQRHRFRQLHQQLLERLSAVVPLDDRIEVLRELIEVAPFDEAAHIELVRALLRRRSSLPRHLRISKTPVASQAILSLASPNYEASASLPKVRLFRYAPDSPLLRLPS